MKKNIKKLLATALSVMLIMSMTIGTLADEAVFSVDISTENVTEITEVAEVFEVTEVNIEKEETEDKSEKVSILMEPEVNEATFLKAGVVTPSDVYQEMKTKFSSEGCTNTKVNDIGSFWNMLAMKALGIPGNTGTDYDKVDYQSLNAQVLAKFIIAMVNDGENPAKYGIKDTEGVLTQNVIELMKSYYNSETGAYGKPSSGKITGSMYHQPFIMYVFGILDEEIGEKAGEYYSSFQNENGILGSSWGIDMDTTSWAILGCHLAGVEYPNEEKALAYMAAHTGDMNANTLGCYLDCLAYLGKLTEAHLTEMVNDENIYSASEKSFLYNKKANASATSQASVPLGEFYNGSVYKAYDEEYVATGLSSKKVYVRIADAKSATETKDILKRTKLNVESGASLVLDGVTTASEDVTLLDVFTEAVCAEKLGKDPTLSDLEANKAYINEKLAAADAGYGLSLTKLYGYEDGGFGYYINRETMAWSTLDVVSSDSTEVFLFHYDYNVASYAVFDKAEYEATTFAPVDVTVKKAGYDSNWNPVFSGIPATVYAKNGSEVKTFTCGNDGKATLAGLAEGTYELTALYKEEDGKYIVSPYAVLKVAKVASTSKTVYARIADVKSATETKDILKRAKLTVESGASLVLDGITTASENVTLLDVFTEAVCAEKLGKDPTLTDLEANKAYINEKLAAADTGYGLSLTKLYGYEDGGFGYYINRETMAWSPLDAVTANNTEVFLFHYDYNVASYAVFDKAEYSSTTLTPATVTVKKMGYDSNWNPVFSGIKATVYVKNGSGVKTFTCSEDGKAKLSGLNAGTYELTAYFGSSSDYIVSPYALLTVTKSNESSSSSTSGGSKNSGSSSSFGGGGMVTYYNIPALTGVAPGKAADTGKPGAPVTDGTWTKEADGKWTFKTTTQFKSTWAYIRNPYAPEGSQDAWFYFDENGYMLVGWQQIKDSDGMLRWYYLTPVSNGSLGSCFLNGVTPDGWTVNESGAWTVNGVVQETKAPAAVSSTGTTYYTGSSSGTGSSTSSSTGSSTTQSSGGSSSSGTGSSTSTVTSTSSGTMSASLSVNVKTTEGKQVTFSGSKSFKFADYEGYTAYDVLVDLCSDKGWDIEGGGDYVSAINGLAEFDAGSQSGWMYSVNGKYPNVPASDYVLKKGDKVVWRYVTSWVNTGM